MNEVFGLRPWEQARLNDFQWAAYIERLQRTGKLSPEDFQVIGEPIEFEDIEGSYDSMEEAAGIDTSRL